MNEIDLLRRMARRVSKPGRGIVLGIGDDCAVFRPAGSKEDLLFTTDMTIEGVHFRRESHPAEAVGWKTLARGLSDIAAMGGAPRFCLLSLALAPWADQRWVDRFYRGLLDLARRAGVTLAGGDLAMAERVTCDIVVCGAVPQGKPLRRDGARAGDAIYVSGRLGGSALGLETGSGAAWRRHLKPEPRLALGRFLREKLHATACMDLSDGLSLDLRRLCLASGAAAELAGALPVYRGASLEQALHGGEDYELLFTVRPQTEVPRAYERVPLSRIGTIRKGRPGRVDLDGRPLAARGYDHFAEAKLKT
jgi:thiamine-monophosphate kinase